MSLQTRDPQSHIAELCDVKWDGGTMQMHAVRGDQLRAARAMLGLRLQDIQRDTGGAVVKGTLCRLEGSGTASPDSRVETLARAVSFFEERGIRFFRHEAKGQILIAVGLLEPEAECAVFRTVPTASRRIIGDR